MNPDPPATPDPAYQPGGEKRFDPPLRPYQTWGEERTPAEHNQTQNQP